MSLLDLLQQQAALAKQQQQRRQPQAQAGAPGLDVPLATLLAQQNAAAAAAGGGGGGFPGFHSQPLGVPQTGEFLQAPGMPPNFLPIDFGQQQQQRAGGALPPAILQHQQAALAQQAAAPPMPAGMPPVSGAGFDATQPSWAAQAASVPLPTFPLPFGVPTDSAATAGAAAAAAGNAASGAQPAPRRRGRQPRDPSTLTEKQLRAREAQKRFREKQKRQMAEAEEAMGATAAELERLRCVRAVMCGWGGSMAAVTDGQGGAVPSPMCLLSPHSPTHQPHPTAAAHPSPPFRPTGCQMRARS